MRVIDRLRQEFPDHSYSWRYDRARCSWYNQELNAVVTQVAISSGYSGSGDGTFRTAYRISFEKYGPWRETEESYYHYHSEPVLPDMVKFGFW